jgi:ParB family transcriptional regulator, chromosome partitioning protein
MATNTAKGLGKGFDALIPKDLDASLLSEKGERVQQLGVEKVKPNPDQPRKHFDEEALSELAGSIKSYGIVQPLVVTKTGENYVIIAGERRWRAAQIAGLKHVPAIVRSTQELEQLEIALVENVQRVDLSPLEQALSIERLHDQFSLSYGDIAKRLSKATTTVNNIVRLLQLPDEAKQALREQRITEGHARAILALKDMPEKQGELLSSIERYGWSVRQAEQFVVSTKQGAKTSQAVRSKMAKTTPKTQALSEHIKAPVTIKRTAKGGRLEIHFASDKELEKIIDNLLN